MAAIGPVSLEEARDVIADRLQMLEIDPPPASIMGLSRVCEPTTTATVAIAAPRTTKGARARLFATLPRLIP